MQILTFLCLGGWFRYRALKIYRWLIMSSFLLLNELIEEMKNIDRDDIHSNLTPLRYIFEIMEFLQNCKIKKRNIYQEELFL